MARTDELLIEESQPLNGSADSRYPIEANGRPSTSTVSTTSLVLDHLADKAAINAGNLVYSDTTKHEEFDIEDQVAWQRPVKPTDKRVRRYFYIVLAIGAIGWVAALFLFLGQDRRTPHSVRPHDPHATSTVGNGKKVEFDQILRGNWRAKQHGIEWVEGPNGEDGLLLERGGQGGRDYMVVEDVRYRGEALEIQKQHSTTLMKQKSFVVGNDVIIVAQAWPSRDQKKVLVQSDYQSIYRHSSTGRYWIFDVATQEAEPLDPENVNGRIQHASWSPDSDAVVFTRDNNMFMRRLDSEKVDRITTDGGTEVFYGIADWVYEEEVLETGSATWWSGNGKYVAFFRTDESQVPTFPVQYFFSRPSGDRPKEGEERYPDVRNIKYPKAGAPMSVVTLQFYDVHEKEVFTVPIEGDFPDDDRLITEVVWAGDTGKVLIRSTNRESYILKVILIDAVGRSGKTVRERNVQDLDGGWIEVSQTTKFIPGAPDAGRPDDGYVDTVIHDGYDHLAYFTPLDNPEPKMLTAGDWEVVDAPAAIDLQNNLVYFVGTKEGSTQRHLYTTSLQDGPDSLTAITNTDEIGYYGASFSAASQFLLLTYQGPHIPWQKVQSTPASKEKIEITIEKNEELNELAKKTELPIEVYQTITVDGFELNIVERRPPHFDDSGKKKYPVVFYLYNGPGFQLVDRRFTIDFQSYIASSLGYIVVTVDGRGTGFRGRKHRCAVQGNLGYWEAHDQIAAAQVWAGKDYVDAERIAIWGWSYGGFMTLKTLEQDAGQTFKYGVAVAPVTDWRFYDSVYTERYMHTPQHNQEGYNNASISNMAALADNVRFLIMHGVSDDNVHFQNTLQLLDKLDLANVRNYDVHVFPDSDHGIFFHNANKVVYEKLRDWMINAFNGEWLRTEDPAPVRTYDVPA